MSSSVKRKQSKQSSKQVTHSGVLLLGVIFLSVICVGLLIALVTFIHKYNRSGNVRNWTDQQRDLLRSYLHYLLEYEKGIECDETAHNGLVDCIVQQLSNNMNFYSLLRLVMDTNDDETNAKLVEGIVAGCFRDSGCVIKDNVSSSSSSSSSKGWLKNSLLNIIAGAIPDK